MALSMGLGVAICVSGLTLTYFVDLSPGATIVVIAIGLYALGFALRSIVDAVRRARRIARSRATDNHPDRSA